MDTPREGYAKRGWTRLPGRLKERWWSGRTSDPRDAEGAEEERVEETRETLRQTLDRLTAEACYRWDR